MVDTNVYVHRWPFRRLPGDETPALVDKLRSAGVTEAWAGSFEALLAEDLAEVNARLAADCRKTNGYLLPFGSINPTLPDWREDLRRCVEDHGMRGVRLHPNYHGYALDHPSFAELLAAAGAGTIVQIVVHMQDQRTQHPLVRTAPVNLAPLPGALKNATGVRLQLLNVFGAAPAVVKQVAREAPAVFADFAMIEGVHGVRRFTEDFGKDRIVFGSYYPYFYFEAAGLKLKESGLDSAPILTGNVKRLKGNAQ